MLKVKISTNNVVGNHTIMFRCPKCDSVDVLYNLHPRTCYKCGEVHKFDVEKLSRLRPERIRYYREIEQEIAKE